MSVFLFPSNYISRFVVAWATFLRKSNTFVIVLLFVSSICLILWLIYWFFPLMCYIIIDCWLLHLRHDHKEKIEITLLNSYSVFVIITRWRKTSFVLTNLILLDKPYIYLFVPHIFILLFKLILLFIVTFVYVSWFFMI